MEADDKKIKLNRIKHIMSIIDENISIIDTLFEWNERMGKEVDEVLGELQ